MNDDRTLEDRSGPSYDPEPDDGGECCWYCYGEGGWHDCGEDTCPCLYRDGEPEDHDWYDCPECNGSGVL